MTYVGSKRRIAKHILPIILKNRLEGQVYVEPFVGGANLIDKVTGPRLGSDICCYLIACLKHIQETSDFQKLDITDKQYKHIKDNKDDYPDWLVGYTRYCNSFSAKFFGGIARDKAGDRNHQQEAVRNARSQHLRLQGVEFRCSSYKDLTLPSNSLIYCDPPYKETLGYRQGKFDYEVFYTWCRQQKLHGHDVFVSEKVMPDDFECVWSKEIVSSVDRKSGTKFLTDKLFILR